MFVTRKVKVAVAQVSSVGFDTKATLEVLKDYAGKAAREGAELVLFPEAFIGAYPRGATFGASIGHRTEEGRDQFARWYDNAIQVPGEEVNYISSIAAENNIYIVTGVIERDIGTLYCTVLFFGPDGTYMGKHRKLMPTAAERVAWGYGDGSTLPVFDTPIGKMGSAICWENYMPMLRMAYYAKGIQLYLVPTEDARESWLPTMRHIAREGRCFVLSCCQFSRRSDFPDDFDTTLGDDPDTILNGGGSCIIDPTGKVLAGPDFEGDGLLVAELDLGLISKWKFDFDAAGHYARPDVFKLIVNERPTPAVLFEREDTGAMGDDTGK